MLKKIISFISLCFTMNSCTPGQSNQSQVPDQRAKDIWSGDALAVAKAIQNNDSDLIKRLVVEKKVDLNQRSATTGTTLLIWAVLHRNLEPVRTLIDLGANPNQPRIFNNDDSKKSNIAQPLAIIAGGKENASMLELLLQKGATPDAYRGIEAALHIICTSLDIEQDEKIKQLDLFLNKGATINILNGEIMHDTPMHSAADFNQWQCVEYLLNKGADPFIAHTNGRTMVHALDETLEKMQNQQNDAIYITAAKVKKMMEARGVQFPLPKYTIDPKTGFKIYAPIVLKK